MSKYNIKRYINLGKNPHRMTKHSNLAKTLGYNSFWVTLTCSHTSKDLTVSPVCVYITKKTAQEYLYHKHQLKFHFNIYFPIKIPAVKNLISSKALDRSKDRYSRMVSKQSQVLIAVDE